MFQRTQKITPESSDIQEEGDRFRTFGQTHFAEIKSARLELFGGTDVFPLER